MKRAWRTPLRWAWWPATSLRHPGPSTSRSGARTTGRTVSGDSPRASEARLSRPHGLSRSPGPACPENLSRVEGPPLKPHFLYSSSHYRSLAGISSLVHRLDSKYDERHDLWWLDAFCSCIPQHWLGPANAPAPAHSTPTMCPPLIALERCTCPPVRGSGRAPCRCRLPQPAGPTRRREARSRRVDRVQPPKVVVLGLTCPSRGWPRPIP